MSFHGVPSFLAMALVSASISMPLGAAEPAATSTPTEPVPTLVPPPPSDPAPAPAHVERVLDPAEVAADALVVRPLGLASIVVGAAIYVVALPFAAIAGDIHTPARSLVGAPARYTFKRKLGDFEPRPY